MELYKIRNRISRGESLYERVIVVWEATTSNPYQLGL